MTLLEGEAAAYLAETLAETLAELSGQLREAEAEVAKLEERRTREVNVEQAAEEVLARSIASGRLVPMLRATSGERSWPRVSPA